MNKTKDILVNCFSYSSLIRPIPSVTGQSQRPVIELQVFVLQVTMHCAACCIGASDHMYLCYIRCVEESCFLIIILLRTGVDRSLQAIQEVQTKMALTSEKVARDTRLFRNSYYLVKTGRLDNNGLHQADNEQSLSACGGSNG